MSVRTGSESKGSYVRGGRYCGWRGPFGHLAAPYMPAHATANGRRQPSKSSGSKQRTFTPDPGPKRLRLLPFTSNKRVNHDVLCKQRYSEPTNMRRQQGNQRCKGASETDNHDKGSCQQRPLSTPIRHRSDRDYQTTHRGGSVTARVYSIRRSIPSA
jgi:hypothetical protein